MATTILVPMPDTLHFCADRGAHPLLGALPAFGHWSGEMVDEDILNFFYEDPGVYAIGQQVYNEFGCQDTVSFRFEIIDELAIHVPTAFTPNGDDLNEVWKPVIAGASRIEGYHLQVLSRSGQVMFETFQPGDAWDALDVPRQEKLEDVQNSIFMYLLRVLPEATPLEPNPEWRECTGHVMIVD